MTVQGLHHVAYRCIDARKTTDFYTKYLDLDFNVAIAENEVPSTGEWSPHIHIFFQMGDGSCVAFFELPESSDMKLDPNTPDWVQHLALVVDDMETLNRYKDRLEADGMEVVGPIDHQICQSIYFFDPNGHRLELAVNTMTPELANRLGSLADSVLDEWSETRTAQDVDWMHVGARGPTP
ncbi:MAG: VOC family protein [Actinomycetia bacterium]|nr:VOC family protein [Actinomycetes bacterium]MCP4227261.1 VOC family protein [Actinomycetes bacterium]MCP5033507.1 VOC family protein [Actinomycetes bacterium]